MSSSQNWQVTGTHFVRESHVKFTLKLKITQKVEFLFKIGSKIYFLANTRKLRGMSSCLPPNRVLRTFLGLDETPLPRKNLV